MSIGILAYGSLIDNPGDEIKPSILREEDTYTPFYVEFSRLSSTRGDAPTLVPVDKGGAQVKAKLFILKDSIPKSNAQDILYRREIHDTSGVKKYKPCQNPNTSRVCIKELVPFNGISTVLYTSIKPNIDDSLLTPLYLARKAIESVNKVEHGKDGISYLINAIANGITTPLTEKYKEEIEKQTRTSSLEQALTQTRE
jgi:hypothetical protein